MNLINQPTMKIKLTLLAISLFTASILNSQTPDNCVARVILPHTPRRHTPLSPLLTNNSI